jgi:hypothetical protein
VEIYLVGRERLLYSNWGWVLPDVSGATILSFREAMQPVAYAMCPPWLDVPSLRPFVNLVMERYRSLGRPTPYLWYGALLVITLFLKPARRYLSIVLAGEVILLNHALITAMVYTVHPRYVVVINPVRALLLSLLLYLVCIVAITLLNRGILRRDNAVQLDETLI